MAKTKNTSKDNIKNSTNDSSSSYLESQLIFYGSYHSNTTNVLTHIICVPLIVWSSQVWLSKLLPSLSFESSLFQFPFVFNLATLVSVLYSVYYLILDPFAGLLYSPILLFMSQSATLFGQTNPRANTVALFIHVFAWVSQFASHGFAEKRAPALLDGLVQALTLAPLFVFYEVLFFFGIRTELKKKISLQISRNVGAYRASLIRAQKQKQ